MAKENAQAVVFKALEIARLMDEISALAEADSKISDLICAAYPFMYSLDEVSGKIIGWRDAMATKAKVALCP
jgi:hypothetical protein